MIFNKIILAAALSCASLMATTSSVAAQPMDIQECDIPKIKVQMVYLRDDIDGARNKLPKTANMKGLIDFYNTQKNLPRISNMGDLIDIVQKTQNTIAFKTYHFNADIRHLLIYDIVIRPSNVTIVSPNEIHASSKYSKTFPAILPMVLPSMTPWTEETLKEYLPLGRYQDMGFDSNDIVTTLNSVFHDQKAIIECNAIQRANNAQIANADPA